MSFTAGAEVSTTSPVADFISTAFDFLFGLRPKAFSAICRVNPARFASPEGFLVVSVSLAATAIMATSYIGETTLAEGDGLIVQASFLATVAVILRVFIALLLAKIVAFFLDVSAPLRALFNGLCYATIFFIPIGALGALGTYTHSGLILAIAFEVVFWFYAASAMGHFIELPSHTFWRFLGALLIGAVATSGVGVYLMFRDNPRSEKRWNSDPKDFPTLRLSNVSRNPDCQDCWHDQIKWPPGDTIAVAIYYHQSSATLSVEDIRTRLIFPSTIGKVAPVAAELWSKDIARRERGIALITRQDDSICEPRMIGLAWYPEQSLEHRPLLNNQTGRELVAEAGLYLGNAGPGWNFQGSVVATLVCDP